MEPNRQQGLFAPHSPSGSVNEMLDYSNDKFVTSEAFVQLVCSYFSVYHSDLWMPFQALTGFLAPVKGKWFLHV